MLLTLFSYRFIFSNNVFPYYILHIFVRMANMETPLVSIIIPCYNGATTIVGAVRSALDQTYKNIEIIVVDDGSTDSSGVIVREIMVSEPRISLYTQQNKGASAARNFGLHYAQGEYVLFLDADDKLKETYISLALSFYQDNPDTTIVYSNMEFFERETGLCYLEPFLIKSFLRYNCIPAFAMVKTEQIKAIGGFDESVVMFEDWECWMHLLKIYGGNVHRIEEPQYFYRRRFTQDSTTDKHLKKTDKLKEVNLYVFSKHQALYKANGMSLEDFYRIEDELEQLESFKKKYYDRWYRKYFYKWFKPKKYLAIYTWK